MTSQGLLTSAAFGGVLGGGAGSMARAAGGGIIGNMVWRPGFFAVNAAGQAIAKER